MSILTFGLGQSGGGFEINSVRFADKKEAKLETTILGAELNVDEIESAALVDNVLTASLKVDKIDAEIIDEC